MFLINGLYKCLEPEDVISALQQEGLPTELVQKANSWTVQHGPMSNVGYFLISYADYVSLSASITPANYPTLTLTINGYDGDTVTFEKLTLTNAVNILGKSETDSSIVLIKLEDYRWWMKRTYCGDVKKNWIATNDDFDNNFLQENTTNYGVLYTLEEILTEIVDRFRTEAVDTSFSAATYASDATYSTELHNIHFSGMTVLDAVCRLCESARLNFYVKPNGNIYFSSGEATWPDPASKFMETIDSGPLIMPTTIQSHAQSQSYYLYDDRCSNDRPSSTYSNDLTVGSPTVSSTFLINVPYLVQSDYLTNDAVVDSTLDEIAGSLLLLHQSPPHPKDLEESDQADGAGP